MLHVYFRLYFYLFFKLSLSLTHSLFSSVRHTMYEHTTKAALAVATQDKKLFIAPGMYNFGFVNKTSFIAPSDMYYE